MIIKSLKIKSLFIILIILVVVAVAYFSIVLAAENKYIKWVDFTPTCKILEKVANLDIASHEENSKTKYNWIELLSYLAAKYGGDFNRFNQKDLDAIIERIDCGESVSVIMKDSKYYSYYLEAYTAILGEYIGEYEIETKDENGEKIFKSKYGLKVFSPIAKNYWYSHSDDFGNSRSYGYKRIHFGNDLIGSVGTPIVAVESGIVEAIGWNQYGGWRIGIRSFDTKRYYYYAHMRKGHPYNSEIYEGKIVKAGDVIGYLGMTGYSTKEDVNNINTPHLHFGIQLIFNEVQKDGPNQVWIDVYQIIKFLKRNGSEVYYDKHSNELFRKYDMFEEHTRE